MKILHAIIVAGLLSAGAVAAQSPSAQSDPRAGPWLERLTALNNKMDSDSLALKAAAESGDRAKICTAFRPAVENQKSMRDLQAEYVTIDPERAKARGIPDRLPQMDAQIVEMEAQLKAICG